MKELNNEQLRSIKGGISGWAIAGIIAASIFVVGVFDGIARPLRCN